MVIGVLRFTVHLPESASLKDKRQVVGGLLARIRGRFQVAAAEVDELDRWQVATLAVACISNDGRHADQVLAGVLGYVEAISRELLVSSVSTELLRL
ncbi:MAG: DUF503 domain-containing protein [Candidatus Dormibacteraeota bacterium]|nr:DUF503 domain-containing protein [Candidatus Dormibacteraeota bacterium]